MSVKYFCDVCGKEGEPNTNLHPRKNSIKRGDKYVAVFVALNIGVGGWGKGELCKVCALEAVENYIRGVGVPVHGPAHSEQL